MRFKLKIEICELIITFESGDTDMLNYRIEQIRKSFAKLRSAKQFKRDFTLIDLITDMASSADYRRNSAIQKRIKVLLKTQPDVPEQDEYIIDYRIWLNGKLTTA